MRKRLEEITWLTFLRIVRWASSLRFSFVIKGFFIFLSFSTVHFVSYVFYFSESVLIFYDSLALSNFVFTYVVVFVISLGIARIFLFFIFRYLLNVGMFAIFLLLDFGASLSRAVLRASKRQVQYGRRIYRRAALLLFRSKRLLEGTSSKVQIIDRSRVSEFADSTSIVYLTSSLIFCFFYLGPHLWWLGMILSICVTGLFFVVFVASFLFATSSLESVAADDYFEEILEKLPTNIVDAVKMGGSLPLELTSTNDKVVKAIASVLTLGLSRTRIVRLMTVHEVQREFFIRLFPVVAICLSIPFGALRAQNIAETSRYQFVFPADSMLSSGAYVSFLNSGTFNFLWNPEDDTVLVVPLELGSVAKKRPGTWRGLALSNFEWRNDTAPH